jgi:two-component SAPR family response regulator
LASSKLAAQFRAQFPEIRVVFMSGYTRGEDMLGQQMLAKPFTEEQLRRSVTAAMS